MRVGVFVFGFGDDVVVVLFGLMVVELVVV